MVIKIVGGNVVDVPGPCRRNNRRQNEENDDENEEGTTIPWHNYGMMLVIFVGFLNFCGEYWRLAASISLLLIIAKNLGTRKGGLSAYSIFNRGQQRLPGELRVGQIIPGNRDE
eukprot:TRINITY_DN3253_c0_g1_i1.p1 TRINITY_DN3253_c0_g1~~TRINITY_DN3253_c0_g1_i1.p1  ORF type:complete len:114 (-),score=7.02 TRINITY_DN3253_c0_g1_i1:325-666(-)